MDIISISQIGTLTKYKQIKSRKSIDFRVRRANNRILIETILFVDFLMSLNCLENIFFFVIHRMSGCEPYPNF